MSKQTPNIQKISANEIKAQFNRLENITAEFSQKIFELKRDQENFKRYIQENHGSHR